MREELRPWRRVAAWAAVILVATTVPVPSGAAGWLADLPVDLAVHGGLYAGLGWLVATTLRRTGRGGRLALFAALVCGMAFAAGDELHQRWIPGRVPELADWTADVVGLAAGMLAALVLRGR